MLSAISLRRRSTHYRSNAISLYKYSIFLSTSRDAILIRHFMRELLLPAYATTTRHTGAAAASAKQISETECLLAFFMRLPIAGVTWPSAILPFYYCARQAAASAHASRRRALFLSLRYHHLDDYYSAAARVFLTRRSKMPLDCLLIIAYSIYISPYYASLNYSATEPPLRHAVSSYQSNASLFADDDYYCHAKKAPHCRRRLGLHRAKAAYRVTSRQPAAST